MSQFDDLPAQSGSQKQAPPPAATPVQVRGEPVPASAAPRPWRLTFPEEGKRDPYIRILDARGVGVLAFASYSLALGDVTNLKLIVAAVNRWWLDSQTPGVVHGESGFDAAVPQDRSKFELVRECAAKLDDGLSPLVAVGLIKASLGAIVASSLRTGIIESSGVALSHELQFPRTFTAGKMVSEAAAEAANQIGGA